jgi:hypothetical protein
MTPAAFRKLCLSMPGASEAPHFERTSFRVGTRIFATMSADGREAMVPVKPVERCLEMLAEDPEVFIDHGGWTRRLGSLGVRLAKVDGRLLEDLVEAAWERVAAKKKRVSR